ncbi:hypothetical protein [Halorubrum sp. SD690R]|uniref:hypothetical protein n=1 Tax=Halorubrum sp. SD690R TaxID=2518117 RepID=UPI0018EEB8B3|nr:hypothetical protein [Halorubrum sp. SD690R]
MIVDRCVPTVVDPSNFNRIGRGHTERLLAVSVLFEEVIQALPEFRMRVFVG